MRVTIVLNPVSGPSRTRGRDVDRRARQASDLLRAAGADAEVVVTERPGHGREIARAAADRGDDIVCAWGGDGTVNEVASALAFTESALAIVPSGSGNGLARSLGVPGDLEGALRYALAAPARLIDMGEIGGRRFASIAGVGFDARVALRFNQARHAGSGLWSYVRAGLREARTYQPRRVEIRIGTETIVAAPLAIAFANSQQYGNGAIICPSARLDDGLLHLVVIHKTTFLRDLWRVRRLFSGTADRDPLLVTRPFTALTVTSDEPILFQVDGDPVHGAAALDVNVVPAALWVRARPRGGY